MGPWVSSIAAVLVAGPFLGAGNVDLFGGPARRQLRTVIDLDSSSQRQRP